MRLFVCWEPLIVADPGMLPSLPRLAGYRRLSRPSPLTALPLRPPCACPSSSRSSSTTCPPRRGRSPPPSGSAGAGLPRPRPYSGRASPLRSAGDSLRWPISSTPAGSGAARSGSTRSALHQLRLQESAARRADPSLLFGLHEQRDVFPMPEGTADRHEVYTGAVQAVHITEVVHPVESVDVMILRSNYPAMYVDQAVRFRTEGSRSDRQVLTRGLSCFAQGPVHQSVASIAASVRLCEHRADDLRRVPSPPRPPAGSPPPAEPACAVRRGVYVRGAPSRSKLTAGLPSSDLALLRRASGQAPRDVGRQSPPPGHRRLLADVRCLPIIGGST